MNSRPISANMLTCTATLYTSSFVDEDRNNTWGDPVTLENVWFTVTNAQTNGAQGKEPNDQMALYYDCRNSKATMPQTTDGGETTFIEVVPQFEKGQRLEVDGVNYTINSINPCYAFGGVHHYELGLS